MRVEVARCSICGKFLYDEWEVCAACADKRGPISSDDFIGKAATAFDKELQAAVFRRKAKPLTSAGQSARAKKAWVTRKANAQAQRTGRALRAWATRRLNEAARASNLARRKAIQARVNGDYPIAKPELPYKDIQMKRFAVLARAKDRMAARFGPRAKRTVPPRPMDNAPLRIARNIHITDHGKKT